MNEEIRSEPDADALKAGIVRALYDATDILWRDPDPDVAKQARDRLREVRASARDTDDPDFIAAFNDALAWLLPAGPGDDMT